MKVIYPLVATTIVLGSLAIFAKSVFSPQTITAKPNDLRNCSVLTEVTVLFRGDSLRLPTRQGIRIRSAPTTAQTSVPDLEPMREGARILGICETDFEDGTEIARAEFHGPTVPDIARDLGLPSYQSISRLSFGVLGVNGWLRHSDQAVENQNPELLRYRKEPQEAIAWQFAETAGHLANGFRVSSWCSEIEGPDETLALCNLRMSHLDGRIYEVWGFELPQLPQIGEPLPQTFVEMTERVPKIEALFKRPTE